MLYQPNKAWLPKFEERTQNRLCLTQEGGGVYHVPTCEGVLQKKHTRAAELKFPGMSLFGRKDKFHVSASAATK